MPLPFVSSKTVPLTLPVGMAVGDAEGKGVGFGVGDGVGALVGELVGDVVGDPVIAAGVGAAGGAVWNVVRVIAEINECHCTASCQCDNYLPHVLGINFQRLLGIVPKKWQVEDGVGVNPCL